MARIVKVAVLNNNEWKLPFNFAVGLHIAVIVGAVYIPQLFDKKPPFENVTTVDLISMEAPAPAPPPSKPKAQPPPPPAKPKPEVKPEVKKESAPILEKPEVETPPPVEAVKPVSIQPMKRKVKKDIDTAALQRKELETIAKQRAEEARRAEQLAEEAARLAAIEAVNQLKSMIREDTSASETVDDIPPPSPARSVSNSNRNILEKQYFASVHNALHPHWKLPEYKAWDTELVAVVVITIARDGSIIDQYFEKSSGDRLFDQFVLKTLQDGAPLPPIPAAMKKTTLELGLSFVPGSIQ